MPERWHSRQCRRGTATDSPKEQYFLRVQVAAARLAQLVERKALNLVVVGSSPTVGRYCQTRDSRASECVVGATSQRQLGRAV